MAEKNERPIKVVAENRKARHLYAIESTIEAGLILTGSEVKSLREGHIQLVDSYARIVRGDRRGAAGQASCCQAKPACTSQRGG